MKGLSTALAAPLAVLALCASQASALPAGGGTGLSPAAATHQSGHHQDFRKAQAIKALRAEGLKTQGEDGGMLTEAHRAALQRKLDAIEAGNY